MATDDREVDDKTVPLFTELHHAVGGSNDASSAEIQGPSEIESLCMNCHRQGLTRLLLTEIPFFKAVVIMAFDCDHCGYRSSEVTNCGPIEPRGVEIKLGVQRTTAKMDLSRSVLVSDYATVLIPSVELEIPPTSYGTRKARLTTVEGVIDEVVEGLRFGQAERAIADPDKALGVARFLDILAGLKDGEQDFELIIRDPSGNSHIENIEPGKADEQLRTIQFERTAEETELLGLSPALGNESSNQQGDAHSRGRTEQENQQSPVATDAVENDEVLVIPDYCPACNAPGENRMKLTSIPHFKEVMIMSFSCERCGYKSSEVKPGAGIEDTGRRTCLRVTCKDDLSRDILKSQEATFAVPKIGLELSAGTLGGRFTTIEGLLTVAKDSIRGANPFSLGDSADQNTKEKFDRFFSSMDDLLECGEPFTVELDDPTGNSFIQNIFAPDDDPEMIVEEYERTREQNEDLGLV